MKQSWATLSKIGCCDEIEEQREWDKLCGYKNDSKDG